MHESSFRTPSCADARGRSPVRTRSGAGQAGGAKGHGPQGRDNGLDDADPDLEHGQGRGVLRGADRESTPGSTRRSSTCTTREPALPQRQDAVQRRVLLARALGRRGQPTSKWSGVRKFTKKWNSVAALLTPASLQAIAYPSPAILTWAAGAGSVDLSRVRRDRRSRRRRRRAGRDHLERRARLEQRRPADRDVEHQPRRLDGAAPGHLLLAGRARRCRGACRHAVRDHVVRLDLGRDDHADRDRHGAGRRDLRPALPVGADSRCGELPDRDQPTSGFATGSKVFSANTSATSFAPTQTLPNNTYYWRVRGVDPQGQAGPWNNGPPFDKTYDQTVVPGPPNLKVWNSKLAADRRRRQRQRAGRHLGHGARCARATRCRLSAAAAGRRSTRRQTPPGHRSGILATAASRRRSPRRRA